jgi:YegS/Rv2252/BmrU family lipid kinase
MRHLFVINPAAGKENKTIELKGLIARAMQSRAEPCEIYVTKGPRDATEKIRLEAESGDELRVYACGGDGTLNECVCGAAGRENVAVTHFPGGTGNDFVRCFGAEKDRFRVLDELLDGEVRPLDIIDCNGRKSVNICYVGIDARIGTAVHKYSALPLLVGKASYITSAAVNLIKGVKQPLRVRCGGKLYQGEMSLICACNGSYYGGGFHPVPEARPDDGVLDFLIVRGVSRLGFVRLVGAYAKGKYASMPEVITHIRGDSIEIESDDELAINVDGEAIYGKTVTIRLEPRGVNFIVPRNMGFFRDPETAPIEMEHNA